MSLPHRRMGTDTSPLGCRAADTEGWGLRTTAQAQGSMLPATAGKVREGVFRTLQLLTLEPRSSGNWTGRKALLKGEEGTVYLRGRREGTEAARPQDHCAGPFQAVTSRIKHILTAQRARVCIFRCWFTACLPILL